MVSRVSLLMRGMPVFGASVPAVIGGIYKQLRIDRLSMR